ncbi:hypothetical protein [Paucimonas lemoignei]|uniref:hypothetical protein n=1 Tax=Paucimonas lemoignei TaxID=29443 RepID=UPI001404758F|nr:hypothetical protein [Paucimonas lemoignei]
MSPEAAVGSICHATKTPSAKLMPLQANNTGTEIFMAIIFLEQTSFPFRSARCGQAECRLRSESNEKKATGLIAAVSNVQHECLLINFYI